MLSTVSVSSPASEGVVPSLVVDDAQQMAAPATKVEVGSIFVSAWGVGQTNIDFYQVVGVTAKTVVMQAVQSNIVEAVDWAAERVEPVPDAYVGRPLRRKLPETTGEPFIGISSWKGAWPWDGRAVLQTHYA